MKKTTAFIIALVFMGTSACQVQQAGQKQSFGTLLGAVAGGIAGAQVGGGSGRLVATAAGSVLGAFLGSEVGASLDKADLVYANNTAQRAFERNPPQQSSSWRNPESGNAGIVTPTTPTYQTTEGSYCREYQQSIFIEGREQKAFGRACRNEFGEWEIQ